jgi:D-proline reductase (dithiol) PrdB
MLNSLKITLALIKRRRPDFEFKTFRDTPVTPLSKPLNKCRIALITTGGLHLRTDPPFDLNVKDGDSSYRAIPGDARAGDLHIAHKWYNHKFINADLNCVFPIARMKEYVKKGTIGSLSKDHYSFMGHIYKTDQISRTSKRLGGILKENGVDAAFLTPT